MTDRAEVLARLQQIRDSSDDLVARRDSVLALLTETGQPLAEFPEAFEVMFPPQYSRARGASSMFAGTLKNPNGLITARNAYDALRSVLAMAVSALLPISAEASEEMMVWCSLVEAELHTLGDLLGIRCAFCGGVRHDNFAVLDGWVLCLTTPDDSPSCFTRVHDHGEPLGSAHARGQD
jgi:hypothetical protein